MNRILYEGRFVISGKNIRTFFYQDKKANSGHKNIKISSKNSMFGRIFEVFKVEKRVIFLIRNNFNCGLTSFFLNINYEITIFNALKIS